MPPIQPQSEATEQGNVVSLFCGCGGLDDGFIKAGFKVELALDHDPAAVVAYTSNLGHVAQELDVRDVGFLEKLVAIQECDVLLGGFPCQGFSKAGPKREADERNLLYQAMIAALDVLRPKMFVAENVDGLAQNYNGSFLRKIVADCANVGYRVEWRILDAAWFGVPQHRRRIAIVGIRVDLDATFEWPEASHRWIARNGERAIHGDYPRWAATLEEPRTVKDAFAGLSLDSPDHDVYRDVPAKTRRILERVPEGSKLCNARHDATSVRTWDIPEAFGAVSSREREILETIARNRRHKTYGTIPNGNPLSLEVLRSLFDADLDVMELNSLVDRGHLKRVGDKWDLRGAMFASGLYKRPPMDLPSPTVLTVFGNPRYFAHPREPRPFTVRETARLQSFPDEYEFDRWGLATNDAYRLIGNAVPPVLARHLADAVAATLRAVAMTIVGGEMVDSADVADSAAVVA